MSESGSEAAQRLTEAFGEPYREVVWGAVEAQQRNVQLAQGWVESVTGVLESGGRGQPGADQGHAEPHYTPSRRRSRARKRTSRALAEPGGIQGCYRAQHGAPGEELTNLVQGFFGDVTSELREGIQGSQEVALSLMEGLGEADGSISGDAWRRDGLLRQPDERSPSDLYRKNLEAFGKQGQ